MRSVSRSGSLSSQSTISGRACVCRACVAKSSEVMYEKSASETSAPLPAGELERPKGENRPPQPNRVDHDIRMYVKRERRQRAVVRVVVRVVGLLSSAESSEIGVFLAV